MVICFFTFLYFSNCNNNSASANSHPEDIWRITGKKIRRANSNAKNKYSRATNSIILKGKDVIITQEEIKRQELLLSNNTNEKKAKELVKTRKTLYHEALKNGYKVSKEEVRSFKEEFEKSISDDEEAEKSIVEFYNAYGGKELYWSDMERTYEESLLIQKYLNHEKELYLQQNKISINSIEADELWEKEEKKLTDRLVAEQNFN